MGRYKFRLKGRNEMRDLPPLPDLDEPSPRPSGGPGVLVPAVVALREDGSLELKPTEGSTAEERELIGRICLCRWMPCATTIPNSARCAQCARLRKRSAIPSRRRLSNPPDRTLSTSHEGLGPRAT